MILHFKEEKMKEKRSFGTILLQIALGIMFLVGGIFTLSSGTGDQIAVAIRTIFTEEIANVVCIILAVIEIILGVFLILRLFINLGTKLDSVLMLIVLICWIVVIVLADFLSSSGLFQSLNKNLLRWLYQFASHLIILGAIIKVRG